MDTPIRGTTYLFHADGDAIEADISASTKPTRDATQLVIALEKITEEGNEGTFFIHTFEPGKSSITGPGSQCERRIDVRYLDKFTVGRAYPLRTYRNAGQVFSTAPHQVCCYSVSRCSFPTPPADNPKCLNKDGQTDIHLVSDKSKRRPKTIGTGI
ncbi:hypothetical protein M407DRAFT_29713 [Tulasnella calospora MUT 4182]|uniref:NAD-specific glutamate dehydrogenase second domain-containing protein n=1 Tax=Tulasnella calospora MUT 4182 TaxID=1051891 RepID=A0A0C3Q8J8_9AGAM|nr:hypothetical protein M407DRAFT_29713 [Tulasnella calospora MUT 4182]